MSTTIFIVFVAVLAVVRSQIQQYCKATSPDTLGPYFMNGAPVRNTTLCDLQLTKGIALVVSGRVTDETCQRGIPAIFEVWQADDKGIYSDGKFDFGCRAKIFTDPQGYYKYTTIFPARYSQGKGGYRPAHIHYLVNDVLEGGHAVFITQMYFKNDPFLAPRDACGPDCNSGDPTRQVEVKVNQETFTLETTFNIALKKDWRKH